MLTCTAALYGFAGDEFSFGDGNDFHTMGPGRLPAGLADLKICCS